MPKPRLTQPPAIEAMEPFLLGPADGGTGRWFVYLFALTDCTAFKVAFSCQPLQRICTFSRRYYERFDLLQSWLFEVNTCDQARERRRSSSRNSLQALQVNEQREFAARGYAVRDHRASLRDWLDA